MAQGPKLMRHGRKERADEPVGEFLERELGDVGIVLHDLRVPGSRANIDHVVVAPSGVWVVDSTWRSESRLDVDGSGGLVCIDAMERQARVVASAVSGSAREVPIRAALCFRETHWGGSPRAFWIDGLLVTYPTDLVGRVRQEGSLDEETVGWIAARVALDFLSSQPSSQTP